MSQFNTVLLCLGLLCLGEWAQAQKVTQTIRGEVLDKATQLPLIGATITLLNTDPLLGTATDELGKFMLEQVPIGRYDVAIGYLGYATFVQEGVLVRSSDDVQLTVELVEANSELGEIVVSSNDRQVTNAAAVVSARSFNLEELSRIPGSVDDPARMARKFPGISPNAQATNNTISVRGNAARALLWRLDEIDIYNPNHFGLLGGSGGTLTLFSQRLLTNTDFYSGAFPADYGNTLGGVFDVRFRNGNTEKRQHSIQLGVLGVDLATEGYFKKGMSSYLVNYRLSSTALVDFVLDVGAVPLFQDLSFKLHFKLKNKAVINVFGVGGISRLTATPVTDTSLLGNRTRSSFGRDYISRTGTVGISYLQPLSDQTYMKHTLLGTGMNTWQTDYYLNRDLVSADTARLGTENDFRVSYSTYINHRFNDHHQHRSGIMVHGLYANMFYLQSSTLSGGNNQPLLDDTLRRGGGLSALFQAYSRSQFSWDKWQLNVGVHAMVLAQNGTFSIEPRLGGRYRLGPKHHLSFGYGLHSQMEPFFTYVSESQDTSLGRAIRKNNGLDFNKAHHLVLGYKGELLPQLRLGVEVYYQYQYDLVVGANLPISRVGGADFRFEALKLNNGGTGQSYGVEIALEKSFSKSYFILFNVSLFEATYMANDGIIRPSSFNAGYIFNLVGGKEWQIGKRKASFLNLNLSATYSGPQYYTPLDGQATLEKGYFVPDYNRPNDLQQSPLLIVDFSLVYKLNGKKTNSQFTLQVGNILNQRPIVGQFYNYDTQEVEPLMGIGILPVLSWRISF